MDINLVDGDGDGGRDEFAFLLSYIVYLNNKLNIKDMRNFKFKLKISIFRDIKLINNFYFLNIFKFCNF